MMMLSSVPILSKSKNIFADAALSQPFFIAFTSPLGGRQKSTLTGQFKHRIIETQNFLVVDQLCTIVHWQDPSHFILKETIISSGLFPWLENAADCSCCRSFSLNMVKQVCTTEQLTYFYMAL